MDHDPWFASFLAAGIVSGAWAVLRRGSARGLRKGSLLQASLLTVLCALLGAHVAGRMLYEPVRFAADPAGTLLSLGSIASVGAMAGGLAGVRLAAACGVLSRQEVLPFLDCVAFTLPWAWSLGRIGCAAAADHPGPHAAGWFSALYSDGSRLDMARVEIAVLVPLGVVFLWMDRRAPRPGTFFGLFLLGYGVARLALDAYRIADPRYWRLTPAQHAAVIAGIAGLALLSRSTERAGPRHEA
ncbi:MAG TPA: prolipoprotein diacylglyceryl transferase family protein [Candidatus Polarisedimenticolia bacterium]|nr:prolipoprotein diacylglyceryl transferase family protein [Candidatus Polarisedimenticolia bacterium]